MGNHVNGGAGVRRKFFFWDVVYGQKRLRTPELSQEDVDTYYEEIDFTGKK